MCFEQTSLCLSMISSIFFTLVASFSKSKLKSSINIIYHQYGYINFNSYKGLIIEDSVDSLVKKNGKLFLAGGNYEIWSLNKILGSFGGAILWCKNKRDYEKIVKIRDNRNIYTNLSWFIKLISTKFNFLAPLWYKIEILGGPVPKWALKQLSLDLKNWDEITKQRLKSELKNFLNKTEIKLFYKSLKKIPGVLIT